MADEILRCADLVVRTSSGLDVVSELNLDVGRGEVVGIAGESGCGKSTLALSLLGYARSGLEIVSGSVTIDGVDVLQLSEREQRRVRGREIAYVSQDASKSLNPSMRVARLLTEVMSVHGHAHDEGQLLRALETVRLPATADFLRRYPHQLSGGQQQRLAIAIAMSCQPKVLVLDEPTTGLDVVTQQHVLGEVGQLAEQHGIGCVFVSHDLAAMAEVADRIAVLYAGRLVELGPAGGLLREPRHPYSSGLIASVPSHEHTERLVPIRGVAVGLDDRPTGCAFAPRCDHRTDECNVSVPPLIEVAPGEQVRCLHWAETARPRRLPRPTSARTGDDALLQVEQLRAVHGRGQRQVIAASEVSFTVRPGECVALVGESGSGKSTIARCVAGLLEPRAGSIVLDGDELAARARDRSVSQRRHLQIVFQNPYDSLNPSRTVRETLRRPIVQFRGVGRSDADDTVDGLLDRVRLPRQLAERRPSELSGGERQRVAIARALAAEPTLLICDEVTSSLDVSVQAAILEVLRDLEVAMLFITHDLGVVASIADRVLVLESGEVREHGEVVDVLKHPEHPYSQQLIGAVPTLPTRENT